jgi:hypothetical protein
MRGTGAILTGMKKLEPIKQAVPATSQEAWVQVNFTAAHHPAPDGSDRYAARPVEAFIRVVPAAAVDQNRLDNPIQPTYLRANPNPVDCEFAYFTTDQIHDLLRQAMRDGYGVPTSPQRVDVSEILEHIHGIRNSADDVIARAEAIAGSVNELA